VQRIEVAESWRFSRPRIDDGERRIRVVLAVMGLDGLTMDRMRHLF